MPRRRSARDNKPAEESRSLTTTNSDSGSSKSGTARSPRRMRLVLIALLVAAGLFAAAPTLISLSSIPNDLLASQLPAEVGSLSTTSAQIGWMGPTSLSGLQLKDASGNLLAEVEQLYLDASLTDLLLGSGETKRIALTRPIINVLLSPEGSNWEAFLDTYSATKSNTDQQANDVPDKQSQGTNAKFDVVIDQAQIRVTDVGTKQRWRVDIEELNLNQVGDSLDVLLDEANFEGTGSISGFQPDGNIGPTAGKFRSTLGTNQAGGRFLEINYQSVRGSILGPLLRRLDPSIGIDGIASGNGSITWVSTGFDGSTDTLMQAFVARRFQSTGTLSLDDAVFQSNLTGKAPVRLKSVTMPWQIAAQNNSLVVDRLTTLSDIGQLDLKGTITEQDLIMLSEGKGFLPTGMQLSGNVDLVTLARIAPDALRLQQGVRLDRGRVLLSLQGDPNSTRLLRGELLTDDIAGVAQGQAFSWQKPLRANFSLTETARGWSLAALKASSTFFTADVQNESIPGGEDQLRSTARFDLNQLSNELRQFVDLGDWQLSGEGNLTAVWQQPKGKSNWRVASTGKLDNVFIGRAARPIVAEKSLTFESELFGQPGSTTPTNGELTLRSGGDVLRATLKSSQDQSTNRPLSATITGKLESWYRRARLVATDLPPIDQVQIAGSIDAKADGLLNDKGGRLDRWQINLDKLRIVNESYAIEEPRIEASGDLSWDNASNLIQLNASQLASSTVSFSAQKVILPMQSLTDSRGEFFFRADLSQLQRWFTPPNEQRTWRASGGIEGRASLEAIEGGVQISATTNGKQCKIIDMTKSQNSVIWAEPQIKGNATFELLPATASDGSSSLEMSIQELNLQSETAIINARGQLGNLGTLDGVDLSGRVGYDLEKLTALMFPQLGNSFHLVGQDQATFRLVSDPDVAASAQLPMTPLANLKAKFEAPWQSGDLFGLPIGQGKVGLVLEDGLVKFDPLDFAIAQGRLTAQPNVTLAPPPTAVSLQQGPLVSNVSVSLEVADRILKFIAPVLADAARIEGNFSLALGEFAMPVNNPELGRATGLLTIHQARVLPGPGVAEWVALAQQVRGIVRDGVKEVAPSEVELLTIQNQAVEFQMAGGRVYHKRLDFQVGDVTVISQGSVGVDETLDIVLSIPVLDEWIEKRPILLAGFRGQAIQIPIRGTLADPKIDREVLRNLAGDLLRSAAEGAINSGIDALFKRLQSR